MNLNISIKYEALKKKGRLKGFRILDLPKYEQVCFSHSVQLAQSGVIIRALLAQDDINIGHCNRCIGVFEPFEVSLGEENSEYEVME